jgi:hypothetical protein
VTGWWTGLAGRMLLMLGLAYAALWWSYERFYDPFGVAPQDVGLTPSGGLSDIIGAILRLGIWLALALILLGLLPVIAVSASAYVVENDPVKNWRKDRHVWVASLIALLAAAASVVVYVWLTGWPFTIAAALVAVLAVITWWYNARHPKGKAQPDKPQSGFRAWALARKTYPLRVFDVFVFVAIIGLFLVDLPGDAADAADCVLGPKPHAVNGIGAPWSVIHLTLLDVHAQPAVITPTTTTVPPKVPRGPFNAVYLGTANGWALFYRKTPSRLLRYPAGDVLIEINPKTKTCSAAH